MEILFYGSAEERIVQHQLLSMKRSWLGVELGGVVQDRIRGACQCFLARIYPCHQLLLWSAHTFSISLLQCFRCATCASGMDRIVDRAVVYCNDIIDDQPL